jgi:hypothetical protein
LKPLPRKGVVTDVPGPKCNRCSGTLIPQEARFPWHCAQRMMDRSQGGRCGKERPAEVGDGRRRSERRLEAGRKLPPCKIHVLDSNDAPLLKCTHHYCIRVFSGGLVYRSAMYIALRSSEAYRRIGMTIEESMTQQYGPLLSITQLAAILDRTPEGLRITLRSSAEWVNGINSTRLQLGRRVYFRTSEIAALLAKR